MTKYAEKGGPTYYGSYYTLGGMIPLLDHNVIDVPALKSGMRNLQKALSLGSREDNETPA